MTGVLDTSQLISVHGKRLGLNRGGALLLDGYLAAPHFKDRGVVGQQYDHFAGNALQSALWTVAKGSDAGCANFAKVAKVGGYMKGITGANAGVSMATNGCQITSSLDWDPGFGAFLAGGTAQMSAITNMCVFFGMLDSIALNMPFTIAGGVLTANASNGFGFLFDTAATAATWKCVSVNATVAAAIFDTGKAPVANTDDLFGFSVDAAGDTTFWLNGNAVLTTAAAEAPGTALALGLCAFSRSAADVNVLTDFMSVEQSR